MILRITILCVSGALLILAIRHSVPDIGLLVAIAVAVLAMTLILGPLKKVFEFLMDLTIYCGISSDLFLPLYKVVGIALVVKVGSSLCQDAKEAALAAVIEISGTICALLSALPLLEAVMALMMELVR